MELRLIQPGEPICLIQELSDNPSLKFRILEEGRAIEAFLIRFSGRCYAYKNRCAHMRSRSASGTSRARPRGRLNCRRQCLLVKVVFLKTKP
jgi:nitrite reductase/ring-hydroxylating ferredoxin subunit